MLLLSIYLFIILIFVMLYFIFKKVDKRWSNINDYMGMVTNTVNSVRYGNLAAKIEQLGYPNCKNLSESINRMVETLNDREKMIVEYQAELTRQNKFLGTVIDSLSDGILIVDEEYNILRATPKIAGWFDENGANLIGKNVLNFFQFDKDLELEKLNSDEITVTSRPASTYEASTMELFLEDKRIVFVVLIKDVTNQRELEKIREDFIATLTHDLKVPIVAESNILDFLISGKFGDISDKQREAITNMKNCNQELVDLVQILLDTYKIKETGVDLLKEPISLIPFINSIVEEMLPIVEKANLKINFKPECEVEIDADKLHLKRVIKNLISNAISHSASSKDIDVVLNQIPGFVTITVVDYGIGISKEDLEKIFKKYYSTAQKFRKIGTGLGLYLSQQIVKSHGGEIVVSSQQGVSTEFCIKLPV